MLVFDVFSRVVYLDFPLNKHGKNFPENGLLEYDPFLLGAKGLFSGAFAVSFQGV